MFGQSQLPAYASTVSAELVRILRCEGIIAAADMLDDLLITSPKEKGLLFAQKQWQRAQQIMRDLGLPANDKGQQPALTAEFIGLLIDTSSMTISITPEHRQYAIDRTGDMLQKQRVSKQEIQSISGSIGWLAQVIRAGRIRRHEFDAAASGASATGKSVPLTRAIR